MTIQSMQGTPWHVEILKMREGDRRRHKSRCINYKNGMCLYYNFRCPGSKYCDKYREIKKIQTENLEPKYDTIIENISGTFTVLYINDKEVVSYEIGKTIRKEAPLVKLVLENNLEATFELNGSKIKLIKKNIYFKN